MSLNSLALDYSLWSIIVRFSINLLVLFILIRVIYYKYCKKEEYMFSFFLMGIMIFLVCSLLKTEEIQLGMALGLFAIFAILRFRTRNLSVKDMTYIFTSIGISVINALARIPPPVLGAIMINSIILLTAYLLEIYLHKMTLSKHLVIYDKLELLNPALNQDLLKDISLRIGQNIEKVKIQKIDLSKGTAEVEVFFRDKNILVKPTITTDSASAGDLSEAKHE
jgi:Domain of unknown function (DUF4956)